MVPRWETIDRKEAEDLKIFKALWMKRRHPGWKKEADFIVLDSPRWVNIIPVTKDGNVVFVEQYRHGIDEVTLEIPGGLVEVNEEPLLAAERECKEETGYKSNDRAILLGENQPNPAFLNNICYSYVWFGCEKFSVQQLDGNEDINVLEFPFEDVKKMIIEGKIKHSLVLTAFLFYFLKYS